MIVSRSRLKGRYLASLGATLSVFSVLPNTIGYQDLAALLAGQPAVADRWRKHIIASPFGTIHAATFSFPRPIGTVMPQPLQYRLASLDSSAADVTGSIRGVPDADPVLGPPPQLFVFPKVDRNLKGDRLVVHSPFNDPSPFGEDLSAQPSTEALPEATPSAAEETVKTPVLKPADAAPPPSKTEAASPPENAPPPTDAGKDKAADAGKDKAADADNEKFEDAGKPASEKSKFSKLTPAEVVTPQVEFPPRAAPVPHVEARPRDVNVPLAEPASPDTLVAAKPAAVAPVAARSSVPEARPQATIVATTSSPAPDPKRNSEINADAGVGVDTVDNTPWPKVVEPANASIVGELSSPDGEEKDPSMRMARVLFGADPLGLSRDGIEPWEPGEAPTVLGHGAGADIDPDIKTAARSAGPETDEAAGDDKSAAGEPGETIASKGEVNQDHQRLKSPAERLKIVGKSRVKAEKCLADAIYFESRGEKVRGQIAVAQVVMNRVFSPFYPNDVCGVVYQNAHRKLACQFTFACDGKPETVDEPDAWKRAQEISRQTLDGKLWLPKIGKATHYHAYWVHPWWVRTMRKLDRLGVHTFYRPRRWGDGSEEPTWGDPKATAELAKTL